MTVTRREFMKTVCAAGSVALLKVCSRAEEVRSSEMQGNFKPGYMKLEDEGRLAERIEEAYSKFESCDLCPRLCQVNRSAGERGFCNAPLKAMVYSHSQHFGEELPLVGRRGSGTIFFSNCSLRCVFCQNYPISHEGRGREITDEQLADIMLDLQGRGCPNINFVTPTHVVPNILAATRIALKKGLRMPLCYNTSGYERVEVVKLLDGIVDLYLPDFKFFDSDQMSRFSLQATPKYSESARESVKEMYRQVGDLVVNEHGEALQGVMIRHLVMPNRVAGTRELVQWITENLSPDTYVNIMAQYRVEFRAFEYEKIAREITSQEFVEAKEWAIEAGLKNLDNRSLAQLEVHRRRIR